jgi:hypothetical protein
VVNETEQQVEQEAQTNVDDGTVDVHEAKIEDLDAALANAQAQEQLEAEAQEPEAPTPAAADPVAERPEAVAAQGADASKPASAVQTANAVQTVAAAPAKVYTQEEIQAIVAENERQKKQGDQKELFIQRRNSEYGQLKQQLAATRSQLEAARAELAKGLEDRFSENPVQAINDRDRIKEIDSQIEGLNGRGEKAERIVEAQTFFLRHVDVDKITIDDVSEVLKADGVDDRFVSQFKQNPWEFTTPEALVQMGKRAMDRKELATADNDRRVLARHVINLNAEIAKLKNKPGQVMQQVQKNLSQAPSVNAASSATPRGMVDLDPTQMSTAELDAALKAAGMR